MGKNIFNIFFNKLKNNSGFSLIEIMVAFLVFTITLIPIIGMIATYHKQVIDSGVKVTSSNLAQGMLEEFKSKKNVDKVNGSFDGNFSKYTYEVTTKEDETNTYEVTIIIKYNGEVMATLTGEIEKQ